MILFVFAIHLVLSEVIVAWLARKPAKETDFDVILLLGANGNISSPVTADRAQNAAEAASRWPNTKIVMTGNERQGEVSAYKTLLSMHGIAVDRIIEETQSRNTWDNITYSKSLIPIGARVLLVTSEYHQPRALAIARALGVNAYSYGRDPRKYQDALYFFLKERASIMTFIPRTLFFYFKNKFLP